MARAAAKFTRQESALGLLAVLTLLALMELLARYADAGSLWKRRQNILVVFDNVATLGKDAPVRYNGIEVGRVKALHPVHLDDKTIAERFRKLERRDLDNLPLRADSERRALKLVPDDEFDAACKRAISGTTMVELELEVLAENDPIRYREDDEVRIVSSIFGDSAVEIISGSGPIVDSQRRQFILGNSGDFFSNLLKSARKAKEILGGMLDLFGVDERASFNRAQKRYQPASEQVTKMSQSMSERAKITAKRFDDFTTHGRETLKATKALLEGLRPSAQATADSVQESLKEIKAKVEAAREEARVSMKEISEDAERTRVAVLTPWQQARDGLEGLRLPLIDAKDHVERAPARFDTAADTAGSMSAQSEADLARFSQSLPKILYNLKITGFVAKEHKDLMLGNGDKGEYLTATVADIRNKVDLSARRMREAGADAAETAQSVSNEFAAEPVLERTEKTVRALAETRASLDALSDELDAKFLKPWTRRKRAAWRGDGITNYELRITN
jgi:hypothetical protein